MKNKIKMKIYRKLGRLTESIRRLADSVDNKRVVYFYVNDINKESKYK